MWAEVFQHCLGMGQQILSYFWFLVGALTPKSFHNLNLSLVLPASFILFSFLCLISLNLSRFIFYKGKVQPIRMAINQSSGTTADSESEIVLLVGWR